jgi:hypothetical protein
VVERQPSKLNVVGSNPISRFGGLAQLVEHLLCKQDARSSSLLFSTSFFRNMKPVEILLLISDLEGSYQHTKKLGFDEDRDVLREMCDKYYKLYFKLKKEQSNPL